MNPRLVVAAGILVLAGCVGASSREIVSSADCRPQTGMTGDLSVDVVGTWLRTWTGTADGGPSSLLMQFGDARKATTTGSSFGVEEWSYRVVEDQVWMSGADTGDDLQSLRMTWLFDGETWNIASDEWYGDSLLEACTSQ